LPALLPLVALGGVLVTTMLRGVRSFPLGIWLAMDLGALTVLATGQIGLKEAAQAIDPDVMLFLLGMFIIGSALELSGYLSTLTTRLLSGAKNGEALLLRILLLMGLLSAILMNDTLAVIGTPALLSVAERQNLDPRPLLLALAFAITIGSAMSPIGNPQNLLIATGSNMREPFSTFLRYLFVPTLLNLLSAFLLLRAFYGQEMRKPLRWDNGPRSEDRRLASLCRHSLELLLALSGLRVALAYLLPQGTFRLSYIALASSFPLLLLSGRRIEILRHVDWRTLAFFLGMFVLMRSVWLTGTFQAAMGALGLLLHDPTHIILVSLLFSQLLSNVPLTALLLPSVMHGDEKAAVALAAGSTIAGNFTLLGAASNIIIIQGAEARRRTLSFWDFVRVGAPLTAVNSLTVWAFLVLL